MGKKNTGKPKTFASIEVRRENGVFKVPADFAKGFNLVPMPGGKMSLSFWEKKRMKMFLKRHGFAPEIASMLPVIMSGARERF